MQHLEVSCAVRSFFKSLGFKGLTFYEPCLIRQTQLSLSLSPICIRNFRKKKRDRN